MTDSLVQRNILEDLIATTDEEFVKELIDAYLEDSPTLIDEMKTALQNDDPTSFRIAAHSLKSTSASLGAIRLSEISKELEMIGNSGNLNQEDGKIEELITIFQQVKRELKAN
jgi:HPt (histidine-containing phosphotransfer) domain-containing protein